MARGVEAHRRWVDYLQPGQTAVDIGANTGLYTRAMIERVGICGHVYAVEPQLACCNVLRATYPNVLVVPVALGARSGCATLWQCELSAHGTFWPANAARICGQETVPVLTVDQLVEADVLPSQPDFIKIDAQGADVDIVRGASTWLRQQHATWHLEVWPMGLASAGATVTALCAIFHQAGYLPVGMLDHADTADRSDYAVHVPTQAAAWAEVVKRAGSKQGHAAVDVLIQPIAVALAGKNARDTTPSVASAEADLLG